MSLISARSRHSWTPDPNPQGRPRPVLGCSTALTPTRSAAGQMLRYTSLVGHRQRQDEQFGVLDRLHHPVVPDPDPAQAGKAHQLPHRAGPRLAAQHVHRLKDPANERLVELGQLLRGPGVVPDRVWSWKMTCWSRRSASLARPRRPLLCPRRSGPSSTERAPDGWPASGGLSPLSPTYPGVGPGPRDPGRHLHLDRPSSLGERHSGRPRPHTAQSHTDVERGEDRVALAQPQPRRTSSSSERSTSGDPATARPASRRAMGTRNGEHET